MTHGWKGKMAQTVTPALEHHGGSGNKTVELEAFHKYYPRNLQEREQ